MKVRVNDPSMSLTVGDPGVSARLNPAIVVVPPDPFEGPYAVTPAAEAQVLHTEGLSMTGDVTINPIPSNYGLITWNGTYLTVS